MSEQIYVDTMAFLNKPGFPPALDSGINSKVPPTSANHVNIAPGNNLDLALVTVAPPFFRETSGVLNGATAPSGRHILGALGYREYMENQPNTKVVLSANDLGTVGDSNLHWIANFQGSPADVDKGTNLKQLFDAGIRTLGFGYNDPGHPFAAFTEPTRRLDNRGKRFIDQMAEQGMMLDVSHAGSQAVLDAVDWLRDTNSPGRIFVSHTGLQTPDATHARNFPPEVMEAIVERGGVIGIYALAFALHEQNSSVTRMTDNLAETIELVGEDNVTLGTDGIYSFLPDQEGRELFKLMSKDVDAKGAFRASYPPEARILNTPHKLKVIEAILRSRSFGEERTKKVMGTNALRFFKEALPQAA